LEAVRVAANALIERLGGREDKKAGAKERNTKEGVKLKASEKRSFGRISGAKQKDNGRSCSDKTGKPALKIRLMIKGGSVAEINRNFLKW